MSHGSKLGGNVRVGVFRNVRPVSHTGKRTTPSSTRLKDKTTRGDKNIEHSLSAGMVQLSVSGDGVQGSVRTIKSAAGNRTQPTQVSQGNKSNGYETSEQNSGQQDGAQPQSVQKERSSTFSCEIKSDVTTPWLRGLTCLEGGDIICLDLNNACLKRFTKNLDHVSSIEISPDNNGLTSVSDTEVAVTCLNEVHFYNVGKFGMNRLPKHFRLQGIGYGISHNNNWFAVTCDIPEEEDATVRILDEDGNEQYVIETREADGVYILFSWYVQLNEMKEEVYVADAETPRIVCFSFYGDIIWKIPVDGGPRDLILKNDYLLVSNQKEHQVVKVALNGLHCSKLYGFGDGIINPDYLAACRETGRIYVTYRGFGTIGVFDP